MQCAKGMALFSSRLAGFAELLLLPLLTAQRENLALCVRIVLIVCAKQNT